MLLGVCSALEVEVGAFGFLAVEESFDVRSKRLEGRLVGGQAVVHHQGCHRFLVVRQPRKRVTATPCQLSPYIRNRASPHKLSP